jgi:ElaB/YqjD/DUF883 family membrane-anchored ribosome-binding protein
MEAENKTSNDKITAALELLNEAASEKKDDFIHLVSNKYHNIKEAFTGSDFRQSVERIRKNASNAASRAKEISEEKVKEIATNVDQNVHENPWPYIGAAAIFGLILGISLGRRRD